MYLLNISVGGTEVILFNINLYLNLFETSEPECLLQVKDIHCEILFSSLKINFPPC